MTRRISSADIDRLFELVERNRANDVYGEGLSATAMPAGSPVWKGNHDFWVEQLKEETGQSWSEQQYNDAANLINFAEYQQVVLNDFTKFVAGNDDTALTGSEESWGHSTHDLPDTFATVADQIQIRAGVGDQPRFDASSGAQGGSRADFSKSSELNKSQAAEDDTGPFDLAAIGAIRSRESGAGQFNQIRSDLFVQTGLSALRPYASWDDFQIRNGLSTELIEDLQVAYPDGFNAVDMWVAGLAELSGTSGEVSTLQAAISDEVDRLYDASDDLGLVNLLGTDLGRQLDNLTYTDIVDRHSHSARFHDTLSGHASDSIPGSVIRIDAGAAGLIIHGSHDDDVLAGGAGNDVVFGGDGDDVIAGGDGSDTLYGGRGHDTIHGDTGNDVLRGGANSDELFGDQGDDTLDGQAGADVMYGGDGNDTIYIDDQGDVAIEAADAGTDTANVSIDCYVLPENVEILIYIGDSSFIGTGNELANYIQGGSEADVLTGGDGDDTLDGGDGSNIIEGGLGSDVILIRSADDIVRENADEGTDTIETTLSSYTLSDNVEILVHVGGGDFTGIGNALNNFISGSDGNDSLSGGDGSDTLDGGDGDDTLDGGEGDDWVVGGQGDDFVMFTRGSDTLVLRQGFGNDVVYGFDPDSRGTGGSDRIDVSSYGYTADSLGVDILMIYDGDSTIVQIGADSVKLVLVDIHTMDRQDFIFS